MTDRTHEPMPHPCPFDSATDATETMVRKIGDHHKKQDFVRGVCELRRTAIRLALGLHPCEESVVDRDGWRVCPNTGIVNATMGMTTGSESSPHVDIGAYGKELAGDNPTRPASNTGQYL